MSAIKALLEQQRVIYEGIARATGMPYIGGFTEEEMGMGRYDHNRADEAEIIQDQEFRWGEERKVEE